MPPNAPVGQHDVKLTCPDGQTATTSLTIVAPTPTSQPTVGPQTGGGYLGNEGSGGI